MDLVLPTESVSTCHRPRSSRFSASLDADLRAFSPRRERVSHTSSQTTDRRRRRTTRRRRSSGPRHRRLGHRRSLARSHPYRARATSSVSDCGARSIVETTQLGFFPVQQKRKIKSGKRARARVREFGDRARFRRRDRDHGERTRENKRARARSSPRARATTRTDGERGWRARRG